MSDNSAVIAAQGVVISTIKNEEFMKAQLFAKLQVSINEWLDKNHTQIDEEIGRYESGMDSVSLQMTNASFAVLEAITEEARE
jgi:hypothetical protein